MENNNKIKTTFDEINLNDIHEDRDAMMKILSNKLGFISDIGRKKKQNQDYAKIGKRDDGTIIMVVADGVTTSNWSEYGSQLSCEFIFEKLLKKNSYNRNYVKDSIKELNDLIIEKQNAINDKFAFQTTLIVAMIKKDELLLAWLGDSRAYLFDKDECYLLSHDDSYVNELLKLGKITVEDVLTHPKKHVITQCIGLREIPKKSYYLKTNVKLFKIPKDSSILLCSDGLWSEMDLEQDYERKRTIEMTLMSLIKKANKNGGSDNITAALYLNKE